MNATPTRRSFFPSEVFFPVHADLALATYVSANPGLKNAENSFGERIGEDDADRRNPSGGRLFPEGDQYGRFMDCLRRIIEHHEDVFLPLGVRPGDLGSHSARKGACGGKYCVSADGINLPAGNVEHRFGEGVVSPV